MKFKSVASILKFSKTIIINESTDCQWLSDGVAFYPCYGFPKLTPKTIFTLLDISEKKVDNFYVKEQELPVEVNFDDGDLTETMLKRGEFEFYIDGMRIEPLISTHGILFINTKYLKPFSDEKDGVQLYERKTKSGAPYIAIKSGFILIGVIAPINVLTDTFFKTLEIVRNLSQMTLEKTHCDVVSEFDTPEIEDIDD